MRLASQCWRERLIGVPLVAGIVFQGVNVSNLDGFDISYTKLVRS